MNAPLPPRAERRGVLGLLFAALIEPPRTALYRETIDSHQKDQRGPEFDDSHSVRPR